MGTRRPTPPLEAAPPLESLAVEPHRSSYLAGDVVHEPLVQGSSDGWQRGLTLPVYALDTVPPRVGGLNRYAPRTPDARAPVLPSLFLPGFPKSATTFLFKCMLASFSPERVGCGPTAANWTASACQRRFLLTALRSDVFGQMMQSKETFYFGGNLGDAFYQDGLLSFHGPDPRPPPLSELPALWPWAETETPPRPKPPKSVPPREREAWRLSARAPRRREMVRRARAMCEPPREQGGGGGSVVEPPSLASQWASRRRSGDTHPPRAPWDPQACNLAGRDAVERGTCVGARRCSKRGVATLSLAQLTGVGESSCTHPACERIARHHPTDSRPMTCFWDPTLHVSLNQTDTYCLHSLLPWAKPAEFEATVGDFTPNYLCNADAMQRIRRATSDPARYRFVVVMRDPVMRSFSEWNMFALKYKWEREGNFSVAMARKAEQLRQCDPQLFRAPQRLRALSTKALGKYIRRCFGGGKAMQYLATSLYGVCIEHALRLFGREQFLFLRYEDLKRMQPAAVIRLIARFTGLSADAALSNEAALKQCTAWRKKPRRSNAPAEQLAAAAPPLQRIFDPYNHMLTETIHQSFRWTVTDHIK